MCWKVRATPADHPDINVQFYANALRSVPDNTLVSEIHSTYTHTMLERSHGYVQWIFPVYENAGMNPYSQPLTKEGAQVIRENLELSKRVLQSYRLMLNFYGCELVDERTGEVRRAPNHEERYAEHNYAFNHNWLRISRIIVSLGELGFGRYKRPFLDHLRREVESGALAAARDSLENFWTPLVTQEDAPAYKRKTLEDGPQDRGESVFFSTFAEDKGS